MKETLIIILIVFSLLLTGFAIGYFKAIAENKSETVDERIRKIEVLRAYHNALVDLEIYRLKHQTNN